MRPGVLAARLSGSDRLLLLLTAVWAVIGVAAPLFPSARVWQMACQLCVVALWATIVGVVAWTIARRQHRPARYGFSFERGGLASLATLAVIHAYLILSGKFDLSAPESVVWKAWGAFMEEIAFRAIAINTLILLMKGTKATALWAILASSALWTLPHLFSKSPGQALFGIFPGGLLFGYVYYKSRSILLPAWLHVAANAGYLGGLFIAALYCIVSAADGLVKSWTRQAPPPALPAHNSQSA